VSISHLSTTRILNVQKDAAYGMKLLTKQPSCFLFVNLIFEVHNLLLKLWNLTTCETSLHIKGTNFQVLWSSENPIEHELWHICLFSFHMCYNICHDLNFGLTTKAKAWKCTGQKCNPGITFAFLGVWESLREWTHTLPNGLPLWELKYLWNPKFSKKKLEVKIHWVKELLIPLELYWNIDV